MQEIMLLKISADLEWNAFTMGLTAIGGAIVLVLLAYLILSVVESVKKKKENTALGLNISDTRILIYNLNDKTIRYFDKKNMKNQKVTTIEAFLSSLKDNETADKIKNWIDSYVNGNGTESSFLTVKAKIPNERKECISIYRVTSFNPKKQILHFENSLLPDVVVKKSHKNELSYIRKLVEIGTMIQSSFKTKYHMDKYLCYYIKLIPYLSTSTEEEDNKNTSTRSLYVTSIYQPLNGIQKLLSKKRYLSLISDKEAAIIDFSSGFRTDVISFCNLLLTEIQRYFSIKSLNNLYDVAIGVSYSDGVTSFDDVVNNAKNLSDKAGDNESIKFLIEGDSEVTGSYSDSSTPSDVASVIKNKTYRCYFTPLISNSLNGSYYLTDIRPFGVSKSTSFTDLVLLSDKFGMLSGLTQDILTTFNEIVKPVFKQRFIIKLPISKVGKLVRTLSDKNNKAACEVASSLAIMFGKTELHDFYEADNNIVSTLKALKDTGVELVLLFNDNGVDSPSEILSLFDMFILSSDEEQKIHGNERRISQLISDYSILSSYKKPMVIVGTDSISDIKVCVKLGFSSFISYKLAGYSSSPYQADVDWSDEDDDGDDELTNKQL